MMSTTASRPTCWPSIASPPPPSSGESTLNLSAPALTKGRFRPPFFRGAGGLSVPPALVSARLLNLLFVVCFHRLRRDCAIAPLRPQQFIAAILKPQCQVVHNA